MAITHFRPGDIVFTVDRTGTIMHTVISSAQIFGDSPGHRGSVHAGLALQGPGYAVAESVGSGLRRKNLGQGDYRIYCYRGPMQKEMREAAVWAAEGYLAQRQLDDSYGKYDKVKGALSPLRPASGGKNAIDDSNRQFGEDAKAPRKFFCSNFVFRCYAAAAEMMGMQNLPIPDSHPQLSPRDLEGLLIRSPIWHVRNNGNVMSHP